MRGKVPNILSSLEDPDRHQGAVSRLVARQRRKPSPAQVAHPDQAAEMARLQLIEDAARDVVVSAMCGEPMHEAIEALRMALGIECSPV